MLCYRIATRALSLPLAAGAPSKVEKSLLAMLSLLYISSQTSLGRYITKKVAQFALYDFSTFGWKMGFEHTTKNHHIPHIINKLQQQLLSTCKSGYKYAHNFLLFEQRYTKIRKSQKLQLINKSHLWGK